MRAARLAHPRSITVVDLSTNNVSLSQQFVDCALTEARRVATMARKTVRGGRRMPIYPYGWYDYDAMYGGAARSQYVNASGLHTIFLRAAMKHGTPPLSYRDTQSAPLKSRDS